MNIKGKVYPEVNVLRCKVPEFDQEVKVVDGLISVITINEGGEKFWTPANRLKTEREANEKILELLIWSLCNIKDTLGMSKAALKRELVRYGLIS